MTLRPAILAALIAVDAAGCAGRGAMGSCDPGPRSVPETVRDSLNRTYEAQRVRGRPRPMPDDEWAIIARELPGGFAGLFFDTSRERGARHERGPLVVMLADTSRREEALAAIAPRIAAMYGDRHLDVRGAAVRRARWDFAQLYDWYNYLRDTAWAERGVSSSDIDEVQNRIVYGVVSDTAKRRLEERLASAGIPCELVVVRTEPPIRLLDSPATPSSR